jgi:hypothetical protein
MADTRLIKTIMFVIRTYKRAHLTSIYFLMCALLTNPTCLYMHYTGTKHYGRKNASVQGPIDVLVFHMCLSRVRILSRHITDMTRAQSI